MKNRFLIPVMAMFFAISMSFASVDSTSSATGFIETDEGWKQVDLACNGGVNTCRMYYSSDPSTIYIVYDAPGGNPLKSPNPQAIEVRD